MQARVKYRLAAFTLFRNEAPELAEWIEFHRLVGVEHFYLYDHQSDDASREVLAPYLERGVVTLSEWSGSAYLHEVQIAALRDCVRRVRRETRWLAFFDVDEFLFPRREDSLVEVLERHYRACSSVSVHWCNFGPSGFAARPPGLTAESYTRRAERDHPLQRAVKTIYRPGRIVRYGGYAAHRAWCLPPTRVDAEHLQLNHYWTRSEDALRERCRHVRGMLRDALGHYGLSHRPSGWQERLLEFVRRDHAVEDLEISRFLPALRARMTC